MEHICPKCNHHITLNTREERFWACVDKNGSTPAGKPCEGQCWIWCGNLNPGGYGRIGAGTKYSGHILAHRFSWELHNRQKISDGLLVRHRCDNRACINPSHLLLGTIIDNVKDRQERGPSKQAQIIKGAKHVCPNCNFHIPIETPEEKFWAKVDKLGSLPDNKECEGVCWIWCGNISDQGYGRIGDKRIKAHRESWKYWNKQDIPDTQIVRHMCDNRLCVNPSHLLLGTKADNNQDTIKRGRSNTTKLTEEQVKDIRVNYATGNFTLKELGETYGVSSSQIHMIVKRKSWQHAA